MKKMNFLISKNSCAIYYDFDFQNYAMGNINRIQF